MPGLRLQLGPMVFLGRREMSTVLLVLGTLLLVAGGAVASYCGGGVFGGCVTYPYQSPGIAIGLFGLLLLAVGLLLRGRPTSETSAPHHLVYQPNLAPPVAVSPRFLQPPPPYTAAAGPLATMRAERFCGACGEPNLRASVFCHRCGTMLQPVM